MATYELTDELGSQSIGPDFRAASDGKNRTNVQHVLSWYHSVFQGSGTSRTGLPTYRRRQDRPQRPRHLNWSTLILPRRRLHSGHIADQLSTKRPTRMLSLLTSICAKARLRLIAGSGCELEAIVSFIQLSQFPELCKTYRGDLRTRRPQARGRSRDTVGS